MAYTTIDDPSAHFQVVLYTGNASNGLAITFDGNSNLQPDFVWTKGRSFSGFHPATDTSRGLTKNVYPNDAYQEENYTTRIQSMDSNGFTINNDPDTMNKSGSTQVAWCWKANGGTLTTVNSNGATNKVDEHKRQTNTTAGFAIVTYEGVEDDNGNSPTFTHNLGKTAEYVLVKNRDVGDAWAVLHKITSAANGLNSLVLDTNAAVSTSPDPWDGNAGTTNDVYVKGQPSAVHNVNADGENYVAYCWTSIQGYSKFGTYKGNNNADGPFIYLGFKPAFVMVKKTTGLGSHLIFDHKRPGYNGTGHRLYANDPDGEDTGTGDSIDILSNGFKVRGGSTSVNDDGETFVYTSFAEHPFVSSEGVPVTAR